MNLDLFKSYQQAQEPHTEKHQAETRIGDAKYANIMLPKTM
jgi:hypothetical protein